MIKRILLFAIVGIMTAVIALYVIHDMDSSPNDRESAQLKQVYAQENIRQSTASINSTAYEDSIESINLLSSALAENDLPSLKTMLESEILRSRQTLAIMTMNKVPINVQADNCGYVIRQALYERNHSEPINQDLTGKPPIQLLADDFSNKITALMDWCQSPNHNGTISEMRRCVVFYYITLKYITELKDMVIYYFPEFNSKQAREILARHEPKILTFPEIKDLKWFPSSFHHTYKLINIPNNTPNQSGSQ